MLRAAQILQIPVVVTTQNAAKLGPTVPELLPLIKDAAVHADKTLFSMFVPEVSSHALFSSATTKREVILVGIETHICVTQTALDLLARGHKVYVLADGVSSCNEQEVPVALARLRAERRRHHLRELALRDHGGRRDCRVQGHCEACQGHRGRYQDGCFRPFKQDLTVALMGFVSKTWFNG